MAFKIAFITDTHLYPEAPQNFGGGTQLQEDSVEIYEAVVQQVSDFRPDVVIHGGDIVCGGDSFEMPMSNYQIALDHAQMLGEQLSAPVYYIPGNHDLDPESGDKTKYLQRFGYHSSEKKSDNVNQNQAGELVDAVESRGYSSLIYEDFRLILLDCQEVERDVTHGYVGEEQLDWIKCELEQSKNDGQDVLVFAHQLLQPTDEFPNLDSTIENWEQVTQILNNYDHVLATFHGHLHCQRIIGPDPTTKRLTVITSSTICYPMMWRKIEIDSEQIRIDSIQLPLAQKLAKSSAAHPQRGRPLIGEERDLRVDIKRSTHEPNNLATKSIETPLIKTLILTGVNNHDWEQSSSICQNLLESTGRFSVEICENPSARLENREQLDQYQLFLIDYNTGFDNLYTGPEWSSIARNNFVDSVRCGVNVCILHAANNSFPEWVEYEEICALMWRENSSHGAYHSFDIEFTDLAHPIVNGFVQTLPSGKITNHSDELYHQLKHMHGTDYHVIAQAFSTVESGGTGQYEPMVLVKNYGQARVFHSILGHLGRDGVSDTWDNPDFQTLLVRGCEWAALGTVTNT